MVFLDKSTLKPGDIVGIPHYITLGWGNFRYMKVVPKVINRITPARTKFIMDDKTVYDKRQAFCKITEETVHENRVAECAKNIHDSLYKIDSMRRSGNLFHMDDETLIKTSSFFDEIMCVLEGDTHV